MHPDEAAAVARARDGDRQAFRLLVERHGRSIYRLAFRVTGQREDAEDVVQDTFIRAFRQLSRFELRSDFATWLYRIGFNCAIDVVRRRQAREAPAGPDVLDRHAADPGASGDNLVFASEIGSRIRQTLDGLSAKERTAFIMRHYHDCSIDDIARALDVKTEAAKHAVFRAVRKMRIALGPFVTSGRGRTTG